jgi:hypothetical protein
MNTVCTSKCSQCTCHMAHRPATLQRHYVTKASLLNNLLRTKIIFRRNKLFKVAIGVKIAWITRKCMADSTDCQRSTFRQDNCMFYMGRVSSFRSCLFEKQPSHSGRCHLQGVFRQTLGTHGTSKFTHRLCKICKIIH